MSDPARFFVDVPLASTGHVRLPDTVGHHAVRVLRLRSGDPVILFNGQGGEYHGTLVLGAAGEVSFAAERFDAREAELPFSVCVAQGLCAAEKMDWLIEKITEFGAARLVPLSLERSVVRLGPERADKRARHWQNLTSAATAQCGRNRLMEIAPVTTLAPWLASRPTHALDVVLSPRATITLAALARGRAASDVNFLIGPEGGLSPNEVDLASADGFILASLGPRVLRTESAALYALATLATCWCR